MAESKIEIPETVGGLIDLLSKCDRDASLDVNITEVYDNGSVYPTSSRLMSIEDFGWGVSLTFSNGRTLG